MSNSYYNHGSYPTTGAPGASSALRAELDLITVGFALLPTLSGNANKALVINAGGSAVTVTTGTLALAGNFATTGAFNTTLVQGATTSLTLPVVSGTLATLAGTETLSNKTLVAPALGTPASGIMTNVTGTAAGLTAGNVTTNANLTGDVTSVGNATSIAAGVIVNADINATAAIDDTKLATIGTALKVSNSATTAASANTASAIVARDASGNFTAGTVTAALTGNASTATALATGRTIAITGDLAYTSPSFDGSANVTAAGTLAAVATAGATGSSTAIPVVTINAKGLTTSITTAVVIAPAGTLSGSTLASGVTASSLTSLGTIASLVVTAGTVATTPSAATDIANKSYVDTIAQGLDTKASVVAGTTANIALSGTQTIDGIAIVATDRVLVKNQTAPAENGIYLCASGAWTRTTDMNTYAQVPGAYVFIEGGTTLADTGWVCTSDAGGTLGTTAITWAQFSGAGSGVSSITFGTTGLTPATASTGAVTVAGTLAVANGGTGITSFGTGVATALGVNVGTAGAFVVNGGALGSPNTVGTMPAFTLGGTVSGGGNQINNVVIGTTTPLAGAFTTLSSTGILAVAASAVSTIGGFSSADLPSSMNLRLNRGVTQFNGIAFAGAVTYDRGIYLRPSSDTLHIGRSAGGVFTDQLSVDGSGNVTVVGSLTGGTSGTAYSFSGSAPATSLTLNSSGNLGIGTATPTTMLQIGTGTTAMHIDPAAMGLSTNVYYTGSAYVMDSGSAMGSLFQPGNGDFSFRRFTTSAVGSYSMYIDTSGNLGIGETSPAAKLHIAVATAAVDGTKGVRITNAGGGIVMLENGSNNDSYVGTLSASDFCFRTNNTERARISSAGDFTVSTGNVIIGTAGKGIDFSADPSAAGMTSELLDDYEEGTWTPQITDSVNNATMGASNSGTYTKIGRVVTCSMYVEVTSLGSIAGGNAVYLSGWPFAIDKTGGGFLPDASGLNITAGRVVTLRPWAGTLMRFYIWDATTGGGPIIASQWTASGAAYISVTYTV